MLHRYSVASIKVCIVAIRYFIALYVTFTSKFLSHMPHIPFVDNWHTLTHSQTTTGSPGIRWLCSSLETIGWL